MNERWLEDRDDDISKLFRDNEEQLEETPSFRTWDRVERKLDRRRGQKRKVMYRYTSMVAASIGILAMVYVIGFLDKVSTFDSSVAQKTEAESILEEEQQTSDKDIAVLEKQAKSKTVNSNNFEELKEESFEELSKNEEPIASNFSNKNDNRTPNNSNVVNDAKKTSQPEPMTKVTTKPNRKVEGLSDWSFPEGNVEEEVEEDMEVTVDASSKHSTTYDAEEMTAPSVEDISLNSQGNPIPAAAKKDKAVSSKKSKELDKQRSYTDKQTVGDAPKKTYSINQFNWLNGDWRDISIGGSYENWQIGRNGLSGSGYVIIGNDTSFVEQMRIYQRGKDIFFEGPVDASQKTRKFKLESYVGNEAIFNRKGKNFPNQVIITRHTNSSYSIVYQNKDAIKVDSTEQLYFKYRNRLNSRRAARNMTRY